ncbi:MULTISPECIES: uroporphyrinogen-III C-methyltransferase [Paenibacillus]|uniref:Uroporphyrinogen-III C-methyltransferase n=1 Tax=Paenibacillus odorifer TaxID=189426 RepID=A0A1R0XCK8_9BACL|nr:MULTISPECIES: uroporphyrinogen-III C-methyltransferase [Paenibacillus]ETT49618.1 uroporphyrin-III C-methyltransferase [Paenibacillus sp. FSL H8-237]MEC0130388.1 uroporphyrinogen-III C-methyltransferase [Paenibacillus odorifer]MEC0220599.1 uroporphyrinogen-III C-methyltransferase [Paenibacillus odorifer]OMC94688.1 uroporphyrinogen-III C-methyltransferase [Paenibacillus odorifer]OMD01738.1 uroporphyrinogen-III C-methyltransferase [Paenibacillus odorifer]
MKPGCVAIVGAGPGDPELITIKAMRRIQEADVILYDRLVNEELLNYAKAGVVVIYCGKSPGQHSMSQEKINGLLIQYASEGHRVVRLKGGDPFVFGRGGEEALAVVQAGIPYEVIPGITSAIGVAASAGIPLTHRGIAASFAVVTGSRCPEHVAPIQWNRLAHSVDTLVIYMGVSQLSHIREQLLIHGKDAQTPIALIENGTFACQRTVTGTLENIDKLAVATKIKNPALIIVGEVVKVREQLIHLQGLVRSEIS